MAAVFYEDVHATMAVAVFESICYVFIFCKNLFSLILAEHLSIHASCILLAAVLHTDGLSVLEKSVFL